MPDTNASSSPAENQPVPPQERDLRPPHFLLRTPDGLGSYLDRENIRIVMSTHEPISEFLAPAKLIDDRSPAPGRARQRIEYDLSGFDLSTFVPADPVPATVVARFAEAARAFYARVDDADSRATDHERRLRRSFRLPDPEKEPDAYWIYGPRDDRRLLVLWGCEVQRGSALTLCARSDNGDAPGVVEKLKARGVRWEHLQKEALALVLEKRRPLARFIATPVKDRAGALTAVIHQGKTVPKEKLKPLKHLSAGEIRAFEKEAADFYAGARRGADETVTDYERELRLALRFPDPEKRGGQFFLHEGKLLVVIMGDETRDCVLCPGPDAEIPMPPEEKGTDGVAFVPETLVDRLKQRATPVKQRLIMAGAALVVLLGALWAFDAMADRTPPAVEKIVAENDPTTVRVFFNEAVDPRSLESSDEFAEPVRLRDPGGRYVNVSRVRRDDKDPKLVVLTVDPLVLGTHELVLKGIRDSSRKHNAIKTDLVKPFEFSDTLPPELLTISAHAEQATKLVLVFNEPLDPVSLRNRDNYEIAGFTVRNIEAGRELGTVIVTVDKPFENHGRYSLRLTGIEDRSQNMHPQPQERDFAYVDTIAPKLERVEAISSQVRVLAHFTKRLGAGADNPGLYRVEVAGAEAGSWEPVEVRMARLPDESRPVVEIITAPLRNGVAYRLSAAGVPDRASPPNLSAEADPMEFRFVGSEDKTPPTLGRPAQARDSAGNIDGRSVSVTFSEDVTADSALRAEAWSFVETPIPIESVTTADGAMVKTAVVRTAIPFDRTRTLTLRVEGLTDLVGNVNSEAVSEPFWVSGANVIPEDTTLRLVSGEVQSGGTRVLLRFNEKLTAVSAQMPVNYSITGGRRVARVEFNPANADQVTIILDGSGALTRGTYAVTARNLMLAELPDFLQHAVSVQVVAP